MKDVAQIAGVSIRALHHYDAIGLLVPGRRSSSGYRRYDDGDLLRLQQILVARQLGLSLESIRRSLDDPSFDHRQLLLAQREQLRQRAVQTARMIRAVDAVLAALDDEAGGLEAVDMTQLFEGLDCAPYEDEAQRGWFESDLYAESSNRTSRYSAEDWALFSAEQAAIYADAVHSLKAGRSPRDPESMGIAERHRLSIDRWLYPCTISTHLKLADMYAADDRFSENMDKHGDGLTEFLVAAMRANARRSEDSALTTAASATDSARSSEDEGN